MQQEDMCDGSDRVLCKFVGTSDEKRRGGSNKRDSLCEGNAGQPATLLFSGDLHVETSKSETDFCKGEPGWALDSASALGTTAEGPPTQVLDLSGTRLSWLPREKFVGFRMITELLLHNNRISRLPADLFELHLVRVARLDHNELTDLPREIKNWKRIEVLMANNNKLKRVPAQLGDLPKLRHLNLHNNLLTAIPLQLLSLNVRVLTLHSNPGLPESQLRIFQAVSLCYGCLDLSNCGCFRDPQEEVTLGYARLVKEIRLQGNALHEMPLQLAKLTRLQTLLAGNNQISIFPMQLCQLPCLTALSLEDNKLASLPVEIGRLVRLKVVNMDNNFLSSLPSTFFQLTNLEELSLANNKLEIISSDIGKLKKLRKLNMANNKIRALPVESCSLTQLQSLSLEHNSISVLPEGFLNLQMLQEVALHDNLLSKLPVQIYQLPNIRKLSLDKNPIPMSIPCSPPPCISAAIPIPTSTNSDTAFLPAATSLHASPPSLETATSPLIDSAATPTKTSHSRTTSTTNTHSLYLVSLSNVSGRRLEHNLSANTPQSNDSFNSSSGSNHSTHSSRSSSSKENVEKKRTLTSSGIIESRRKSLPNSLTASDAAVFNGQANSLNLYIGSDGGNVSDVGEYTNQHYRRNSAVVQPETPPKNNRQSSNLGYFTTVLKRELKEENGEREIETAEKKERLKFSSKDLMSTDIEDTETETEGEGIGYDSMKKKAKKKKMVRTKTDSRKSIKKIKNNSDRESDAMGPNPCEDKEKVVFGKGKGEKKKKRTRKSKKRVEDSAASENQYSIDQQGQELKEDQREALNGSRSVRLKKKDLSSGSLSKTDAEGGEQSKDKDSAYLSPTSQDSSHSLTGSPGIKSRPKPRQKPKCNPLSPRESSLLIKSPASASVCLPIRMPSAALSSSCPSLPDGATSEELQRTSTLEDCSASTPPTKTTKSSFSPKVERDRRPHEILRGSSKGLPRIYQDISSAHKHQLVQYQKQRKEMKTATISQEHPPANPQRKRAGSDKELQVTNPLYIHTTQSPLLVKSHSTIEKPISPGLHSGDTSQLFSWVQ